MLEYWLWLAHRPGLTDRIKVALIQHFGSPEAVYAAEEGAYLAVEGITPQMLEGLEDRTLGLCQETLAQCEDKKISILTFEDAEYPSRLKNITDPPLVLYYKGTLPDFDDNPVIGIVGTRKPSAYGSSVARRLGLEVSSCGGLVVSGVAAGVDGAAMNGALMAGYPAVGVLGCGLDIIYPKSNKELYAATEKYGCLLSEFEPGTAPMGWHFPKRNRIISGLSCGVVIIEAPEKSGALITANLALDQGRDVFAVPGNIDLPGFAGSNRLLREGAGAVSCGWDVMSEYQARFPDKIHKDVEKRTPRKLPEAVEEKVAQEPQIPAAKPKRTQKKIDKPTAAPYIDLKNILQRLSADEQAIVTALESGERLVDDVIAQTGIPSGKFLGLLTMLELKGIIQRHPGKRISLKAGKQ